MEGQVKGLILGVVGVLVLALIINIGISIYQPTAVKQAVETTQPYNQTIGGVEYTFEGSGDSPQDVGQEAVDSMNTIRWVANALLGLVFLVLIVLSAVALFGGKKHY
jgi:hypothetical protein